MEFYNYQLHFYFLFFLVIIYENIFFCIRREYVALSLEDK